MTPERRCACREEIDTSLSDWLSSAARQSGAAGFVLTDDDGLLVASDVDLDGLDDLAAMAPSLAPPNEPTGAPISVAGIEVGSEKFWLCALGTRAKRDYGLRLAATGIRRIIS